MPIEFWILLWKVVLLGSVGLFALLAVVVAIGGAFDVCRLLKTLREEHARCTAEGAAEVENRNPQHTP